MDHRMFFRRGAAIEFDSVHISGTTAAGSDQQTETVFKGKVKMTFADTGGVQGKVTTAEISQDSFTGDRNNCPNGEVFTPLHNRQLANISCIGQAAETAAGLPALTAQHEKCAEDNDTAQNDKDVSHDTGCNVIYVFRQRIHLLRVSFFII